MNNGKDHKLGIAIAFIMADNEMVQLSPWLDERMSAAGYGTSFVVNLIAYVSKSYTSDYPKNSVNADRKSGAVVSINNVAISLQFLQIVDRAILTKPIPSSTPYGSLSPIGTIYDSLKGLTEACLAKHPTLKEVIASPGFNMKHLSLTLPAPPSLNIAVFGEGLGRAVKGEVESPESQQINKRLLFQIWNHTSLLTKLSLNKMLKAAQLMVENLNYSC